MLKGPAMNETLNWRYATQKFDPSRKIPKQNLNELLEVLRLAPSSSGLQPWRFVIVQDPDLKKVLRPHAYNQPQITDADTLIVFCALKIMDEKYVHQYIESVAKVRNVGTESLSRYEQGILRLIKGKTPQEISHWMKCQVFIALGVFLSECAHHRIDACPMEGFKPEEFDEILGLSKEGLESVVLCAIGYRAADDPDAQKTKVRFEPKDLFIYKTS